MMWNLTVAQVRTTNACVVDAEIAQQADSDERRVVESVWPGLHGPHVCPCHWSEEGPAGQAGGGQLAHQRVQLTAFGAGLGDRLVCRVLAGLVVTEAVSACLGSDEAGRLGTGGLGARGRPELPRSSSKQLMLRRPRAAEMS